MCILLHKYIWWSFDRNWIKYKHFSESMLIHHRSLIQHNAIIWIMVSLHRLWLLIMQGLGIILPKDEKERWYTQTMRTRSILYSSSCLVSLWFLCLLMMLYSVIWRGQGQRPMNTWIKGQVKNYFDLFLIALNIQFI